jgi:phosphate:Na+ symporter
MQLMSDGMKPLQSYTPFIEFMKRMDVPLLGILFGALFTGMVQSSSATTGIVIVLASQGFLPLSAGIALIFGANIGTCVTAALSAMGKPREAKRAVFVHVLFNVLGVAMWFYFIPQLTELVIWIAPGSGIPRQIANAHAIFNVSNTLILIGFAGPMAWLATKLIPDRAVHVPESSKPKFIDPVLLDTPPLALDMVRLELGRLGAAVLRVTRRSLKTVIHGSPEELDALWEADSDIDALHGAIVEYLGALSQENRDERQSDQLHRYLSAANYFENIGDMVETSLVTAGRHRHREGLLIGEGTENMLTEFHREICAAVDRAIKGLVENDPAIAAEVTGAKTRIDELTDKAEIHLSKRLVAGEPNRLITFRLESEIIEYLKRMFYFAKHIAKLVIEDVDGAGRAQD